MNNIKTFKIRYPKLFFEIYLKPWTLTIAEALCSIGAGLDTHGKVTRGKELGHYAEFGLGSLIPPLVFQFFETEYEGLLSMIPGLGPVNIEIITITYLIIWVVFVSFYFATWLAVEPAPPTVEEVVQPAPKPLEGKKRYPQCGAGMPTDFPFCPRCGAKR